MSTLWMVFQRKPKNTKTPNVAIAGDWFTAIRKVINLGYLVKKETEIIANKMSVAIFRMHG